MRVIFLFFIFFNSNLYSQKLEIINGGKSSYNIIIPAKPTAIEYKSANELQKYLYKISGANLPIIKENFSTFSDKEILVGRVNRYPSIDLKELGGDGTLIKTDNGRLILTGGSRKGVLYSVYTFLEKYLGCRKYSRSDEVIPKLKNVQIPLNIIDKHIPSFDFRSTYFIDAVDTAYADWHKLNYFFENRKYFAHSLSWYLHPDKYFKTHPEYFALIDGKRSPLQPCLSNSSVFTIVKNALKTEMNLNPENIYWSVSQTDNPQYCHCHLCEPKHTKGNGFMETLLPFVNKMADAFPDKIISTLAYNQSVRPPAKLIPRKNVEIMFCLTEINRSVPISNSYDKSATNFKNYLGQWQKLTSNIFVWDYVVNYFHSLSPYPNINTFQSNIKYFKNNNVSKIFEQGIGPQIGEFSELKCYIISKLMWDANIDVEKLKNEFINFFYGNAAPEIREYLFTLESEVKKANSFLTPWDSPLYHQDTYLSSSNLKKYESIFNKAEKKLRSNSDFYQRVNREKSAVEYAEIEIASQIPSRLKTVGGKKILDQKIENFTKKAKKLGINNLANGEKSPDSYLKQYKERKPTN